MKETTLEFKEPLPVEPAVKPVEPASGAEEPVKVEKTADEINAEQIKAAKAAGKEYQGRETLEEMTIKK